MELLWLIYALISALAASLVAIFAKIGLKEFDTNTATAIRALVMTVFLMLLIIAQGKLGLIKEIFSNQKALFYIVLSGAAGAASWLFYFLALKGGKVSQIVPIDRLSIVFALVLALLFLGEQLSLKVAVGAALMVAGAILVALG